MKTIKFLQRIAFLFAMAFTVISCSRDEAPAPNKESEERGHDMWGKVELIFRKGHLHGKDFHGNVDGDDPYFKGTQKIFFEVDNQTMNVVRKNEEGKVLQREEEPILMLGHLNYSLEIIYYNKKGERINSQFVTQEMSPIHQHFFTVKEFTDLNTQQVKVPTADELMDYTYRDTTPEDVMIGTFKPGTTIASKLTNDPVGLKGYFTHKRGRTKYMMNIFLAHLLRGNKYTNNGKAWAFNQPSNGLMAAAVPDFSQSIPMVVVTTPTDGTEESFEKMLEEIAEYFKISVEEVKKNMKNEPIDENSSFWL